MLWRNTAAPCHWNGPRGLRNPLAVGPSSGHQGSISGQLGPIVAVTGRPSGPRGASWGPLGQFRGHLGLFWALLGRSRIGLPWRAWGCA
eukprot:4787547-Pyramimonas_sp.AAC.1